MRPNTYLLAAGSAVRVQVLVLQERERELDWRRAVRVGSAHAYSKAEGFHMSDRLRARLVAGAIDEQQALRDGPPLLFVKLLRQRRDEEAKCLAVSVRLRHSAIQAAARANSKLHCNSGTHPSDRLRVHLALHTPFSAVEVELIQPRLVQVDDASAT